MTWRNVSVAIFLCMSRLGHAAPITYTLTFYNVFHFNHSYGNEGVKFVYAIPEIVDNNSSVSPGAAVRLHEVTTPPSHLFGTGTTTSIASVYDDGSMAYPVELRVRYLVYLANGQVTLSPPFHMPIGTFRSVFGASDDEKKLVIATSAAELANKTDASATANMFYVSEDYRTTIPQ